MLESNSTEAVGFNSRGNDRPHKDGYRQELITAFKKMTERLEHDAFESCLAAIVDGYLLEITENATYGPKYREVLEAIVASIKSKQHPSNPHINEADSL